MSPSVDPLVRPPTASLRVLQILVAALALGLLSFSAVVVGMVATGNAPTSSGAPGARAVGSASTNQLLLVMGLLSLVCAVAGFIMRGVMIAGFRRQLGPVATSSDPTSLLPQFQTVTILRAALAEGPALLGTVIVMISGNWLGFLGSAFGLCMLAVVFPTRGRLEDFARDVTGRMASL